MCELFRLSTRVFGYFLLIDGTSQYIEGREEEEPDEGFCPFGLPCALVLIGVYLRSTGQPVMGVINQPFNHKDSTGKG